MKDNQTQKTQDNGWQKAGPRFYRYVSSGTYFARVRVSGKFYSSESCGTTTPSKWLRRYCSRMSKPFVIECLKANPASADA
jgi:hypothetical protein